MGIFCLHLPRPVCVSPGAEHPFPCNPSTDPWEGGKKHRDSLLCLLKQALPWSHQDPSVQDCPPLVPCLLPGGPQAYSLVKYRVVVINNKQSPGFKGLFSFLFIQMQLIFLCIPHMHKMFAQQNHLKTWSHSVADYRTGDNIPENEKHLVSQGFILLKLVSVESQLF